MPDTSAQPAKRLNWRQACVLLSCSKTKLYDMVSRKELRAYRTGLRGMWFYEEDVQNLIKQVEDE